MTLDESRDVIVVGSGPAGLSAALALGRQRRRVLVCDTGAPANAPSAAVHGALGFDGVAPRELRSRGRDECARYPSVSFRDAEAVAVAPLEGGFRVTLADGQALPARKVILACGRRYELPPIPGARERFGSRVLHCPFCHGWEARDRALAIIGGDAETFQLAVMLRALSDRLILCTNGAHALEDDQLDQLTGAGVALYEQPVTAIRAAGDGVELRLADGGSERRDAIFLCHTPRDHELVERLAVERGDEGRLQVDPTGQTGIPGLYAAGDLCTFAQVTLAISTGAVAGSAASMVLAYEDLAKGAERR
jgi:thioredoxin reductase